MKLFSQIIRTAVNVAILPVAAAADVLAAPADAANSEGFGNRTKKAVQKIKDEAEEE